MKKILILDIGCSFTKGYLFDEQLSLLQDFKVSTNIRSASKLMDCVHQVLSHFEGSGYDAIFPLSFSESIVYNGCVYSPTYNLNPISEDYYEKTGTPTNIKRDIGTVFQTLLTFNYYDEGLALPVSTYVASQLCGEKVDTWEMTHAGNSGLFDLRQRKWAIEVFENYKADYLSVSNKLPFSEKLMSPSTIIGTTAEGAVVFAGGHDHSCISVFHPKPTIIAGTWVVVSYPEIEFLPRAVEKLSGVRWTITANGGFHKQVVMKVSNPITPTDMHRILKCLDVMAVPASDHVYVIGGYSDTLAPELNKLSRRGFIAPPSSETYQHRETAKYALRALELQ